MAANTKPRRPELCDAIARAIAIADQGEDHLTGALLMQAYEAAGCGQPDMFDESR